MMNSCKKANSPDISYAIYNLVQELKPTSVEEYLYNSEKVYHFDTWKGPDDFTCLYSSDGELMAYFGGFKGMATDGVLISPKTRCSSAPSMPMVNGFTANRICRSETMIDIVGLKWYICIKCLSLHRRNQTVWTNSLKHY